MFSEKQALAEPIMALFHAALFSVGNRCSIFGCYMWHLLYRKIKYMAWVFLLTFTVSGQAGYLCFSPVKEKEGDKSTERTFWQAFDYRVQVDNGPVVVPSETKSTRYEITNDNPRVKIFLGDELVESFRIKPEWLKQGRNCIYFKKIYETWSVVEKWQADRLCGCDE
jgi:hypothetical protein